MKLYEHAISETVEKIKTKEIKSCEVVQSILERIDNIDKKLNAFITVFHDESVDRAKYIDQKIKNGKPLGALAGVPIAIKDNICLKNKRTTCGSKMLENYCPPYSATVINKLLSEDAIIIGKTNMDEFSQGSSAETSYFGATRNPWNLDRVPGGTSGGSAAALAANETIGSIGSDTGGSVRQPASFCGVVALKPTYGRISRYGLIAYASSLDTIAPFGKTVKDCAILMQVLSGKDTKDSTSVDENVPEYEKLMGNSIKQMRIGLPSEYFSDGICPDVNEAVLKGVKVLESLGAVIEETSLPSLKYGIPAYYLTATSEVSSNLARYMGIHHSHRSKKTKDLIESFKTSRAEGFGPEVRRRIILGTYALSRGYYDQYYLKAQKVRTLIMNEYLNAFKKYDVLIGPVSPFPAFKLGEKINDPLQMYLSDIYTITINMAGIPAISIPCGLSSQGLPIGMQIIGKHFDEGKLLKIASVYEKNCNVSNIIPNI
jgi:aspartyl-tRNA(Asn)/glutamyl-tRNA(Gln) amidotransferase subunit A